MFKIKEILLSKEQIAQRVSELAAQLEHDYEGRAPMMICILKGSLVFFADLIRNINLPLTVDTMAVSSYGGGTNSSGVLKINKDIGESIVGQDIIIVEDIIDTGLTMSSLVAHLSKQNLASIRVVTLLDKPSRRNINFKADYIGFSIPDKFIVGYGLDFAESYRNLPDICILDSLE